MTDFLMSLPKLGAVGQVVFVIVVAAVAAGVGCLYARLKGF